MKDDSPSKQATVGELLQDLVAETRNATGWQKPRPCWPLRGVVRIHNEWFRLPEDGHRFCDCLNAWRRAAERNPRHRPEEHNTIDHYLLEARKFCLGVLGWEPDAFERTTPEEYEDALAGHLERDEYVPRSTEQKPQRSVKPPSKPTPKAAARQAFANIKGWETMPPERLRRALQKELGYGVSRDTVRRARREHLQANKQT
jgi:hypothetical protein